MPGDILAAWAENRRVTRRAASAQASPEGRAALQAYLRPVVESGAPIPASHKHGKPEFARMYVTGITGASFGQVDRFKKTNRLTALAAVRPGSCPLAVQVTGRVNGRPWRTHLDFYEAPVLMRHLGTAAAIVCLYLTGMRPQEVQSLRSGCCPEPEPKVDGSPGLSSRVPRADAKGTAAVPSGRVPAAGRSSPIHPKVQTPALAVQTSALFAGVRRHLP
ncbi:hypothetical protein AB0M68_30160 [Streptomyces sp. NPDC051453]|uniref:hypothetical protein n=1 Tax=Streptomyces sp. NPDC051453 TaxID=3154941 RepID=UPI00342C4897